MKRKLKKDILIEDFIDLISESGFLHWCSSEHLIAVSEWEKKAVKLLDRGNKLLKNK
jgi:hypothetical protein